MSRPPFFLILAFITLLPGIALAQRTLQLDVESTTAAPLGFAEFRILKADSAQLYSGLTDSLGHFEGAMPADGAAILEVSAYGYNARRFPIGSGTGTFVQRAVLSATSRTLNGITVSSRKPLLERKADRTVFNVESSVAATGSDALEMLKRTPGLRVSDDGIAISGKSSVSVLINDKIVQMSGQELLEMIRAIPSDNLSRIEVITTPPAKYEAQGSAGLVNIVLKKQLRQGINGQVTGSYNQHFYNAGGLNGNFNYRREKLNVFGSGNLFKGTNRDQGVIESPFPGQLQRQVVENRLTHMFNRAQIGADYQLRPDMILGFNYTFGQGQYRLAAKYRRSDPRPRPAQPGECELGVEARYEREENQRGSGLPEPHRPRGTALRDNRAPAGRHSHRHVQRQYQ
jgi:hypothetical protein